MSFCCYTHTAITKTFQLYAVFKGQHQLRQHVEQRFDTPSNDLKAGKETSGHDWASIPILHDADIDKHMQHRA